MTGFLDSLLGGLALGSVYALIALGFVTIFKASGVLSFTHGSLLLLGGYLVAVLHDDLGFAGALAVAVLVTAAVAGALDRLVLQRVGGSDPHAAHVQTIVTIGVDIVLVTDPAWCLAGALAALAAVFLVAFPAPGLERTTGQIALKAFPAAILGGMTSPVGALVGSMLIGLTEAFVAGYQSDLHVLGEGFGDVAPYAVMVLVLLVRPAGLFAAKGAARV